jgi:hypothetical protein
VDAEANAVAAIAPAAGPTGDSPTVGIIGPPPGPPEVAISTPRRGTARTPFASHPGVSTPMVSSPSPDIVHGGAIIAVTPAPAPQIMSETTISPRGVTTAPLDVPGSAAGPAVAVGR